ncbi:unnamed protein product [Penicillium salamii]|nr:unnamed protein product [Penicillium salamii]
MWPAWSNEKENSSFAAEIRELEYVSCEISSELDHTRKYLEDSFNEKNELQAEIVCFRGETNGESSRVSHLEDQLVRVTRGTREVMQVLQVHQTREESMPKHGDG